MILLLGIPPKLILFSDLELFWLHQTGRFFICYGPCQARHILRTPLTSAVQLGLRPLAELAVELGLAGARPNVVVEVMAGGNVDDVFHIKKKNDDFPYVKNLQQKKLGW